MEDGVQICAHNDQDSIAEGLDGLDITEMPYPETFQGCSVILGFPLSPIFYRERENC